MDAGRTMAPSPSPHEGMLMSIPIICRFFHCFHDFLPGFKLLSFQCQGTQGLPPGFDQVQIGGILGLVDHLPTGMLPQKEQEIIAMVHVQVIHDGVHALQVSRQLGIDPAEKIQKVGLGSPWVTLREAFSRRLPQGAEDVAFAASSIIEFLFGPLCWPFGGINEPQSLIAFG